MFRQNIHVVLCLQMHEIYPLITVNILQYAADKYRVTYGRTDLFIPLLFRYSRTCALRFARSPLVIRLGDFSVIYLYYTDTDTQQVGTNVQETAFGY